MTRKNFLFFLLFIISANSNSQDTLFFKLSNPWNTVKDPNGNYSRKCVKEFDYFHVWDYNNKMTLVTESFYSDTNFTKKLFCHKYFNETEGFLEQSRCYLNGQLDGYFVSYSSKGDTISYDIFKSNEIIESWSLNPRKDSEEFTRSEEAAEFPGGPKAWVAYLQNNLNYPDSLRKNNIGGKVTVQVIISKDGSIGKVHVLNSVNPILDEEAIKVIMSSPKWKPAKQNKRTVTFMFRQSINFN